MKNAFDIVRDFEAALCEYTGAPYCVTTNSCTEALGLCFEWWRFTNPEIHTLDLPKKTYVGVAMQAKRAGYKLTFRDEYWSGAYYIPQIRVWDAARRFSKNMFDDLKGDDKEGSTFACLSFHYTKILNITQGGCIIHNNEMFDVWARMMRFDGRQENKPAGDIKQYEFLGRHCYMGPEIAAQGLRKLNSIKPYNHDLPMDDYPDLSQIELFK